MRSRQPSVRAVQYNPRDLRRPFKTTDLTEGAETDAVVGSSDETPVETPRPAELHRRVAFVYRAMNLRIGSVSSMPFALKRLGGDELDRQGDEYQHWQDVLPELLALLEGDLCMYGAAYMLVESNRSGMNFRPRRLLPTSITPKYDNDGTLTGFDRHMGMGKKKFFRAAGNPARRQGEAFIIHLWLPRFDAETGPGVAPIDAALSAAESQYFLRQYVSSFWQRGAIKTTLFFLGSSGNAGGGMEKIPAKKDLDNLVAVWKRLVTGVRRAWETIAMRYPMVPHQIGTDPKDLAASELTNDDRADIAAAFGIPESLLQSLSATYAGAIVDDWHFISKTIVPHLQVAYRRALNQFFDLYGLRFDWRPEEHQSYQAYQVEEAKATVPLLDARLMSHETAQQRLGLPIEQIGSNDDDLPQILGYHIEQGTVEHNEVRERLRLPPQDRTGEHHRRELMAALSVMQAATAAGLPPNVAQALAQIPGLHDGTTSGQLAAQAQALAHRTRKRGPHERERRRPVTA